MLIALVLIALASLATSGSLSAFRVRNLRRMLPLLAAAYLAGALYVVLRDAWHGKSLGKALMGLSVIDTETGCRGGLQASLMRNIGFAVIAAPVLGWILFVVMNLVTALQVVAGSGQRLGEKFARTKVVSDRDIPNR